MHHPRLTRRALGCAVAALLVVAPSAFAGSIQYDIAPSPAYTIDNEQGLVKLTFNGCVTAGQRQTLNFNMITNASNDATVGFKVLKEEGEDPTSTFNPSSVTLTKAAEQTFAVTYSFTLNTPTDQRTTFRFKLDPENGAGLGGGPGVMVNIPCVLAAPPAGGGFARVDSQAVPTSGVLGAVDSAAARGNAACISTVRRMHLRAGERSAIDVLINMNDQNIRNALVRVTLPGGRQVTRRTGSNGIARFVVRPRSKGRAVIQSDVCFGARRAAVAASRDASIKAPAKFTG